MIVLGLDLSFSGAGIALVETSNGGLHSYRTKLVECTGETTRFHDCIRAAEEIDNAIQDMTCCKVENLIVEAPPPNSSYSAGLWGLDASVMTRQKIRYPNARMIHCSCLAIKSFIGSSSATKSQSVETAKRIFGIKGRLDHNQCEALILALIGLYHFGDEWAVQTVKSNNKKFGPTIHAF